MPAKSLLREVPSPDEDSRFFIVLKRCDYPCWVLDLPFNGTFSLLFLERMFFCRWTLQMPGSLQTDYLPINGTFSLLFLERMFFCRWTLQMPGSLQTDYLTRRHQNLSKNIRILSPKNGGYWQRKGRSVEKTPIFDVFRKSLSDRWLHGFKTVISRFTKDEFAKGKVSLRQRPCFVVWKVMFEAMKHGLWRGQS